MSNTIDKIIHGNNVPVMMGFPDECIDLIVTSPPYDNLRDYEGYSLNVPAMIHEFKRIMKPGGVVVWVVGDATIKGSETGTSFRQALAFMDAGFRLHDTMIYKKANFIPLTHNRYEQCFEYMFVFCKGKPRVFNPIILPCKTRGKENDHSREKHYESSHSMRRRSGKIIVRKTKIHSNMFEYTVGRNDKTIHNAPFPERLAADHITSWSDEGDLVLDPMCGSGTTCKMAKRLNRHYCGIDTSAKYCLLARNRVRKEIHDG